MKLISDIKEWLSITGLPFKLFFYTIAGICLTASLFNLALRYNIPYLAYISGTVYIGLIMIAATSFSFDLPKFLKNIYFSISHHWKAKKIMALPEWIKKINEIGLNTNKIQFMIRDDIGKNAYAIGNNVVLGMELFDVKINMDSNEILAIITHELQHIKGHHGPYKMLFYLLIYPMSVLSYAALPVTMSIFAILSALSIYMIPANWVLEIRADKAAGKLVGNIYMINALLKISQGKNPNEASFSHPPINYRIKTLGK